ncbi:ATP-sensitive inward rectifier potassium channel 11-like [Anthonomus grandis grandis]|uniref:ATP-sensitive inward rectifier potassium channel 11-like n=1 Tax=Anthonomus grandis grandis TaxID=2921223 RepID=UPI002166B563|nr:ATP-sensitive inward rectifier potassium channel 11-like [Anthonomus grandis grandis]
MTLWDVQWFSEKAEQVRRRTWLPWGNKKYPKRAILKDGHKNVHRKKMAGIRRWRYLQDIFTTLMDAQWRWTLQFLALEFFGCWLTFALIWWLIAFVHGDLHEDHLPLRQAETGWTPCILNIHGFHSAFLYSLETQHTTGYGLRVITEECPEAIFILVCQCLIGMTLDSFAISIVFAKLIRSKHATSTIQFSRNAVISRREGKLSFMFRVGDLKKSRLAGVSVRAILLKSKRTPEGEIVQSYQTELTLKADDGSNDLFLIWPLIVYHEIDENSPLRNLTVPELMKNQKIEIIVILNATVESTGVTIEAKSSYLANEVLWNHQFEGMVSYNKHSECYETDWSKFDDTRVVSAETEAIEKSGSQSSNHSNEPKNKNSLETEGFLSDEILPPLYQDAYFIPPYTKPADPAIPEHGKTRQNSYQKYFYKYGKLPDIEEGQEANVTLV